MNLAQITPLILAYNEEANIANCLEKLSWSKRIVVVDSFSSDNTVAIARSFKNVEVLQRTFDDHTTQWNFGLDHVDSEWVLTFDADYVCPSELIGELQSLPGDFDAYNASFHYCVFGRRLRASLYPPRTSLFRVNLFRYAQDGHTQLLDTANAKVGDLRVRLDHDDRKPLARWVSSQVKYAALEAEKLLTSTGSVGWKDKIRQWLFLAPILTPLYCLFYKRLLFDGWHGLFYTLQRTFAELVLSLTLLERKLVSEEKISPSPPAPLPEAGRGEIEKN